MIYGLYLSANGLVTQDMRSDIIANNLANASTHGFKRDFLALRQRDPEVIRNGSQAGPQTNRHLLAIGGAVEGDRSHSIFTQGSMQKTAAPLDLAINGKGFFKYDALNGKQYYSRGGALGVTSEGILTGPNGFPILSNDNEQIIIEGNDYFIDQQGRVVVDGEALAQVGIVMPETMEHLHKRGENMFESLKPVQDFPADAQLKVGYLESSSVSPVKEITALIQAHRAYQANAKLITIQDETLGKALSQIAL